MRRAIFQLVIAVLALYIFDPRALARQRAEERADCDAYSGKQVPAFRVGKEFRTDKGGFLVLSISVRPSDVDREKLIALACKIGRDHAEEDGVIVWILDSYKAAKRYSPLAGENERQTNLAYVGSCGFSRDPRARPEQSLDWWPDTNDRTRSVHIDLGPPPPRPAK